MNIYKNIIQWFKLGKFTDNDKYIWVSGAGGSITPEIEFGGSFLGGRSSNYAICLSDIKNFNPDISMYENMHSLSVFEHDTCNEIINKFIHDVGMEKFEDARPIYICSGSIPMKIIETKYGIALILRANFDPITYAGYVTFAVDGIEDNVPKALLGVELMLFETNKVCK